MTFKPTSIDFSKNVFPVLVYIYSLVLLISLFLYSFLFWSLPSIEFIRGGIVAFIGYLWYINKGIYYD